MSTNFLVKKPSAGLSVSVIKKSANGIVISDKVCRGMDYVECRLNHVDEVIELRLIEKKKVEPKPLETAGTDTPAVKEAVTDRNKPATKDTGKPVDLSLDKKPAAPANPASKKALT